MAGSGDRRVGGTKKQLPQRRPEGSETERVRGSWSSPTREEGGKGSWRGQQAAGRQSGWN